MNFFKVEPKNREHLLKLWMDYCDEIKWLPLKDFNENVTLQTMVDYLTFFFNAIDYGFDYLKFLALYGDEIEKIRLDAQEDQEKEDGFYFDHRENKKEWIN